MFCAFSNSALVTGSVLGPITTFEVARFRRFTDAVDRFVTDQGGQGRFGRALFAVAAPINGTRCVLTNAAWVIDTAELQKLFGF